MCLVGIVCVYITFLWKKTFYQRSMSKKGYKNKSRLMVLNMPTECFHTIFRQRYTRNINVTLLKRVSTSTAQTLQPRLTLAWVFDVVGRRRTICFGPEACYSTPRPLFVPLHGDDCETHLTREGCSKCF